MKKRQILGSLGVFALGGFAAYLITRPKYRNVVSFEIKDESERILEEQLSGEDDGNESKATDEIDWNNLPECSESYVYPCKVTKRITDRTTDRTTDTGGGIGSGGNGGGGGTGSGGTGGTGSGGTDNGSGGTGSGGTGGTDSGTGGGFGGGFTAKGGGGGTNMDSESQKTETETETEIKEEKKDYIPLIIMGITIALSIFSESKKT